MWLAGQFREKPDALPFGDRMSPSVHAAMGAGEHQADARPDFACVSSCRAQPPSIRNAFSLGGLAQWAARVGLASVDAGEHSATRRARIEVPGLERERNDREVAPRP